MLKKKISSQKNFLKAVSKRNLQMIYKSEKYGNDFIINADDNLLNYAKISLQQQYISGVELLDTKDGGQALILSSPILTTKGEEYLATQKIFVKHPLIEKFCLVILTGVISALVTLFTNSLNP